jgi:hypothetical protein
MCNVGCSSTCAARACTPQLPVVQKGVQRRREGTRSVKHTYRSGI